MKETKTLSTLEEIKAISDPYRIQIVTIFRVLDRPATVKEIADQMGEVPAKVHYHVKKLESTGILKMVYTKEIKGIIAKYYEPTAEKFEIKSKTMDPTIGAVMLNEAKKAVNYIYEGSKKVALRSLGDQEEKNLAALQTSTIYLTEEEAKQVQNIIDDLIDKNKDKNIKNEKKKSYHFFNALFAIKEEESEK